MEVDLGVQRQKLVKEWLRICKHKKDKKGAKVEESFFSFDVESDYCDILLGLLRETAYPGQDPPYIFGWYWAKTSEEKRAAAELQPLKKD